MGLPKRWRRAGPRRTCSAGWPTAGIQVTMIDALGLVLPGTPSVHDLDPGLLARLPPDLLDPPDEVMCFPAATALGASTVNLVHYMGPRLPVAVSWPRRSPGCAAVPHHLACGFAWSFSRRAVSQTSRSPSPSWRHAARTTLPSCLTSSTSIDRTAPWRTCEACRRGPSPGSRSVTGSPPPGPLHVPFSGRLLPGDGRIPLHEFVEAGPGKQPTGDDRHRGAQRRTAEPAVGGCGGPAGCRSHHVANQLRLSGRWKPGTDPRSRRPCYG